MEEQWNSGAYFRAKDNFETILERLAPIEPVSQEMRDAWQNALEDALEALDWS